MALGSTFVSLLVLAQYGGLVTQYQKSLNALQQHQILPFLRIERVESNKSYQLDFEGNLMLSKNDSTVIGWDYTYERSNMKISATPFFYAFLEINIPSGAYDFYQVVSCVWFVEEHKGLIPKDTFTPSTQFTNYYTSTFDLSKHFWKEAVPHQIIVEIHLRV